MKQYLAIILREQFTLFYRSGYTFIPFSELITFNGIISEQVKELVAEKFKTVTPFLYDEEYLILHIETHLEESSTQRKILSFRSQPHYKHYRLTNKKHTSTNSNRISTIIPKAEQTPPLASLRFEIQNIVKIYTLSQKAKISIESKIDQRIRLEQPIFEEVLPQVELEIERKEVEKAISALWKICEIEIPLEKYIAGIGLENIFNGLEYRKRGTKANKIQDGNYWEYLIAYDRFDYFPNSTLGYFYDAGQVFAYSKGLTTFEGSKLYNHLEAGKEYPKINAKTIIEHLENNDELKSYVSQTTHNKIKQYIVAPLYLMLRDEIRSSDDIAQTKLFTHLPYLKTFEDSFNYVIILLGAFFGFRKFYDQYYDTLNLKFYNNSVKGEEQLYEEHQKRAINDLKVIEASDNSTIDPEKINVDTVDKQQQTEEKESDTFLQYRAIIEEAFKDKLEIELKDIVELIEKKTGKKQKNNKVVRGIIEQMIGIEIIPKKKPETARQVNNLFSN